MRPTLKSLHHKQDLNTLNINQDPRAPDANKSPVSHSNAPPQTYDRKFKSLHRDNPGLHIEEPRSTFALSASTAPRDQLAYDLEQISAELLFISETDLPYKNFRQSFNASELNPETFREALNISPQTEISSRPIEEFFELYQDLNRYAENVFESQKYIALENTMRTHLTQLQVLYVGGEDIVEGEVYIVGLDQSGQIRGLKTGRVWT